MDCPEFEVEGHSTEDWMTDLQNRFETLSEVDKVKDLEEYITELEVFETKEHKLMKVAAKGEALIAKYSK